MEISSTLTSVLALVFVLSLIAVFSAVLKRYGQGSMFSKKQGEKARLSVKEVLIVDGKRKLVLIGRDDKEHLLLLSGDKETLVEADITPVMQEHEVDAINMTENAMIQKKGGE